MARQITETKSEWPSPESGRPLVVVAYDKSELGAGPMFPGLEMFHQVMEHRLRDNPSGSFWMQTKENPDGFLRLTLWDKDPRLDDTVKIDGDTTLERALVESTN